MKGDFSRNTFDRSKHYSAVLKQQGRVDLDADWNENSEIRQHIEATTTQDTVGLCGAPMGDDGFEIGSTTDGDLTISSGRMYVDGVLSEADADSSYASQPSHPAPPELDPQAGRTDLVYLDVWRRHVTTIEDPDIREVALGGPDTTTRVHTLWQVKVQKDVGDVTCADDVAALLPGPSGAEAEPTTIETVPLSTPCTMTAAGGYQGLTNRNYRIEVHDGGNIGAATFKWSRSNGSVAYAIEEFIDDQPTSRVRVTNLGRDSVLSLQVGQ